MIKTEVFVKLNLTGLQHGPNNMKEGSYWYFSKLLRNTKMAIQYSIYVGDPILILDYTNYPKSFYIKLADMYVNYACAKTEEERAKLYIKWRDKAVRIEPKKHNIYDLTQEQAQEILNKNEHLFTSIDNLLTEKLLIAEINEL